jgi:quercetin dioxygenase-like cupin family protein
MDPSDLSARFESGTVIFPDSTTDAADRPWRAPPGSEGVFLKDLATGRETGGKFSYHLVRIAKGCAVANHTHDGPWEWNTILRGSGTIVLGDKEIPVTAGQSCATPPRVPHAVRAGNEDLLLVAFFVPALL